MILPLRHDTGITPRHDISPVFTATYYVAPTAAVTVLRVDLAPAKHACADMLMMLGAARRRCAMSPMLLE